MLSQISRAGPVSISEPAPSDARKFAIPPVRPGAVLREELLIKLARSTSTVIGIVAPAGYGKTTLLAEWAAREPRCVAWISLDRWDDDPGIFIGDIAYGLGRTLDLDPALVERISRRTGFPAERMRLLTRMVAEAGETFVLVLDDVHVLGDPLARDLLATLITQVPTGARVAISSREAPPIRLARLRVTGQFLELGPKELAMDDNEASQLLRAAGAELPPAAVSEVNRRSGGWAAGLYFASLSFRDHPARMEIAAPSGPGSRMIVDYVREEVLDRLPDAQATFVRRSAIPDRLSADLCNAVVGTTGSAALLDELEQHNRFLVRIDDQDHWYRYHQFFRDALLAELARRDADIVPELHRRAASWFEANGYPADAVGHLHAAGDTSAAARVVCNLARPYATSGKLHTVRRWLAGFDDAAVAAYPPLAPVTAAALAFVGDPAALGWLRRAEAVTFDGPMPGESASYQSMTSFARALMAPNGIEQMLDDATYVHACETASSPWHTGTLIELAVASLLLGRYEEARSRLEEAIEAARPDQAIGICIAEAELALIAADAEDWSEAGEHARSALARGHASGINELGTQILAFALAGLVAVRRGDSRQSRGALTQAHRLRSASTITLPWLAVQARTVMAQAHLASGDVAGAKAVLRDAREIERRRPRLGALGHRLNDLEARIGKFASMGAARPTSLSTAELRLLVFLPTHLSFREIAAQLFVSQNTIKSQAISAYRKLGVSGRSDAVERARQLGLLAA